MNSNPTPNSEYRNPLPCLSQAQVTAISKVLADTHEGLTGSEIAHLLAQVRVKDVDPEATKWKRLHNAFIVHQNEYQVGNHIIQFITRVMDPSRYTDNPGQFHDRVSRLNAILSLAGLEVGDDGKCRKAAVARTVDEAVARSNRLKEQLTRRSVHAEVFKYCEPEIVAQNYFHAVFEAMKGIASRLRLLTGLTLDGSELVQQAFSLKAGKPVLAINALTTPTLEGEQRAFTNLLVGLFGYVRNPLAHEAKIEWQMEELDALDTLTTISFIHRKLDKAWKP